MTQNEFQELLENTLRVFGLTAIYEPPPSPYFSVSDGERYHYVVYGMSGSVTDFQQVLAKFLETVVMAAKGSDTVAWRRKTEFRLDKDAESGEVLFKVSCRAAFFVYPKDL
jgi:hypothetical protein